MEVNYLKVGLASDKTDFSYVFDLDKMEQEHQIIDLLIHEIKPVKVLDCRLLSCPLSIICLRYGMKDISVGQILELLVTDLECIEYVPQWCNHTGNDFLEVTGKYGETRFFIRRNQKKI
jgi:TusA-related sulfurtransferase